MKRAAPRRIGAERERLQGLAVDHHSRRRPLARGARREGQCESGRVQGLYRDRAAVLQRRGHRGFFPVAIEGIDLQPGLPVVLQRGGRDRDGSRESLSASRGQPIDEGVDLRDRVRMVGVRGVRTDDVPQFDADFGE